MLVLRKILRMYSTIDPYMKTCLECGLLAVLGEMICKFYFIVTLNLYVVFPIYNVIIKMQIMSVKIVEQQKQKMIFGLIL